MKWFNSAPGKRYSWQLASSCAFMALAVLLVATGTGSAASKPNTVGEVALYRGPDREKVLIEGAKKEGQLTAYISNTEVVEIVRKDFAKKYPFLKVSVWHAGAEEVVQRVIEENAARQRFNPADVISCQMQGAYMFQRADALQEYHTPDAAHYPDELKVRGKTGSFYLPIHERYNSLGFNSNVIPPAEAPRAFDDLLDPKWKGRMALPQGNIRALTTGNILEARGLEYLEKLGRQDVRTHSVSPGALGNLIVAGEVPLALGITDFTVIEARKKGSPIEWRPLEPVLAVASGFSMSTGTPHPHAALLLIDYISSKEGQKLLVEAGQNPLRDDIGNIVNVQKLREEIGGMGPMKFKKGYVDRYPLEEYEKKYNDWGRLAERLFIRRR